jgi:outer membrane protein
VLASPLYIEERNMKRVGAVLVALVLSVFGTSVFADAAKIGVVDLQKIMQTSNQMKDIQQKLEKEFKPRRDKLVAMEATLKADMEKFKRDSAVLSANQKKDTEKKIIAAQQQFERDGQQYQQELSTAHNEAMEGLYTKVRSAINKIAKDDKYDLIVQKDAAPFSAETLDVTEKVIKAIS